MSIPRRLVAELSRRRVFRVAGAYAAAGLAAIYAGDAILPRLGLDRVQTVLVVLVILGLPLALALAWAFDVTPEGVRRTQPAPSPLSSEDERSIVVLPFDNMSPDPQDAYLGDGLTEELTSKLSRLASLRVISRTSATALKATIRPVPEVARELGVRYVLEGSVRKAGERLRITAQLIDALRDHHVWSESYDGTMEDIFAVQERVSMAILEALRVRLTSEETRRIEERPFQTFRAYQYYVRARADALNATEESLDRALEVTERGLADIGENELLLSARGLAYFQYVNSMLKAPARHGAFLDEASRCVDGALALNPTSAPARTVRAFVQWARGDVAGAVRTNTEALALDPNNPEALLLLGYWRAAGGWDMEGARALLGRLQSIDPLTPINVGATGWVHWFEGDFAGAHDRLRPAWPAGAADNPWRIVPAYWHAAGGDIPAAAEIIHELNARVPQHLLTHLGTFVLHAWRGERDAALGAVSPELETAARWDDVWPLMLAGGYASLGELDRAFGWLDRAVVNGIMNVPYLRDHDPFLENMRADSRFAVLLEKAAGMARQVAEAARTAFAAR